MSATVSICISFFLSCFQSLMSIMIFSLSLKHILYIYLFVFFFFRLFFLIILHLEFLFFISHTGGPLLLMELAFLLRSVGAEVCWISNQKPSETNEVIYSLENRMLQRGVQVISISLSFHNS